MATSFVLRLGTYWPWKSQSSYLVITEQAVSALYIKLLQNDRFRPPLVYSFAASRLPLSESGYIAFMLTSSRRRRMWWARKASARGMHVWKGRAAGALDRCTWQVLEIQKKAVRKGMNRTLSNARSVKKKSHFCIMHFLKDNNKRDSYNKLNSLSFCFRVKSLDKGITFPLWATTALQEEKVKIESIISARH